MFGKAFDLESTLPLSQRAERSGSSQRADDYTDSVLEFHP
jgi:hypothetical protein